MAYRVFMRFICAFGVFHKGLTALIETQQTVMAAEGEEALLNCRLIQFKDVRQVTWQKLLPEGMKTNIATNSKYFGERVKAGFEEKVQFKDAGLQSSSIVIRKVTEQDEGCYHCLFNTYPEGALTGTTCLKLWFGLTALIQTQQTVIAAVGDEALLNCELIQIKDVHEVTWWKLLPEGEENLTSYDKDFCQKVNPDFRDKLELKDAGLQNSSIVIKKVTEQDEGCYNCTFTYPEGALTNTTCLKVYGFIEKSWSRNSGLYISLTSVSLIVCGIVAAVILFKQKNKCSLPLRKSEEVEMDKTIKDDHDLSHRNSEENKMDKVIKDSQEAPTALMSQVETRELTPEKNEESDNPMRFTASRRLHFDDCKQFRDTE